MCDACGVPTIPAVTPGGRAIDLEFDHVFVAKGAPWPTWVFILGAQIGHGGRVFALGSPALELDRNPNGRSGPFRHAHACIEGVA